MRSSREGGRATQIAEKDAHLRDIGTRSVISLEMIVNMLTRLYHSVHRCFVFWVSYNRLEVTVPWLERHLTTPYSIVTMVTIAAVVLNFVSAALCHDSTGLIIAREHSVPLAASCSVS